MTDATELPDRDREDVRMLAQRLAERERELGELEAEVERLELELTADSALGAGEAPDVLADREIARLLDVAAGELARHADREVSTSPGDPASRPASVTMLRDPRIDRVTERLDRLQRHVDHLRVLAENLDRKCERAFDELIGYVRRRELERHPPRDVRARLHALRLAIMLAGLVVVLVAWFAVTVALR